MVQELMLDNLNERLHSQNQAVELFIIDNCCKWRKKYTRYLAQTCWCIWTFSDHAVQRITKTINKQHRFYSDYVQDVSKVYIDLMTIPEKPRG